MKVTVLPILGALALAMTHPLSSLSADTVRPALLPQPADVVWRDAFYQINAHTSIGAGPFTNAARVLSEALNVPIRADGQTIRFTPSEGLPTEGYELEVAATGVTLRASSPSGAFYGVQTLLQLRTEEGTSFAAASIRDEPRFAWRGLMLDCSRTFQSIDYLKKTVDRLAAYKMNVLHLHLTDDQGWRMEIKTHPELTRKGARFSAKYDEPESHQGFYTQAEMRDLVQYASLRGVTLVPEIEMPGHSLALLVCRPDLSCSGTILDDIFPFFKGPPVTPDILCAGNDDTFTLLQDVINEVVDVFPSQFIHIGGDEAPKERWKTCPKCQARIKAEGLKDEHELQSYFIRRIEKQINAKGRRLIGWSEILQGGLAPNAAVMDWIGGAAAATKSGHDAVMSPTSHCYFDYPYSSIDEKRAYSFDPAAGLSAEQARRILGLQANFWSHIDREPTLVDRQLFPRLLSIAERGWSPATTTNWQILSERLTAQLPRLRQMDVHYRTQPVGRWTPQETSEQYSDRVWDITPNLNNAGEYLVTFTYTGGACRLGIESVDLLVNGKVISTAKHRGVTGATNDANTYRVQLQQLKAGTRYELRASIRSEGGTDSKGEVFLEREEASKK